jgi:hypothetical protein
MYIVREREMVLVGQSEVTMEGRKGKENGTE